MKFSIVVPSFNHATFLSDCLDSIFSQQSNNVSLEVIVMDGGSSDGSVEIIQGYDDRLAYWVSAPDGGQTAALIEGFSRCTGEVMCWLNSDDLFLPNALECVQREICNQDDVDVFYGDARWITRDGKTIRDQKEIEFDLDIFLWTYNYIPQPSTFWRRRIWDKSEKLDSGMICAMDYDLWLKFISAGARFAHVAHVLAAMRRYPEQKNQRLRSLSNKEDTQIRERFLDRRVGFLEKRALGIWNRVRRILLRLRAGAYFSEKGLG
tara:strand:- start:2937 stop:3728 length:792 start_codon:yes stop_codon:yes gene_type:complete